MGTSLGTSICIDKSQNRKFKPLLKVTSCSEIIYFFAKTICFLQIHCAPILNAYSAYLVKCLTLTAVQLRSKVHDVDIPMYTMCTKFHS